MTNLWRWTGLFAVLTLAVTLAFGRIPDIDICGTRAPPILALELIASPAEAEAVFPADCSAAEMVAQRTALWLDNFAYIPVYGLFLICALLSQVGERSARTRPIVRLLAGMVAIAMLADWWENSRLLEIAKGFPGTQALVDQLYPAVRLKFLLLGFVTTMIGVLHMRAGGWRRLAGGIIAVSAAWAVVTTLVAPHKLTYPMAVAWGTLALLSVVLAIRPPAPIAD